MVTLSIHRVAKEGILLDALFYVFETILLTQLL